MRIGVVSDPHGCLVGLRTALDWLEKERVDVTVCAGDVANFGPQPNECIPYSLNRASRVCKETVTVTFFCRLQPIIVPMSVHLNSPRSMTGVG
jgi:Icc-related predicted phosphoesterase